MKLAYPRISKLKNCFSHKVPAAPGRIKAVATGARTAIVSWSRPKPPNGKIIGYTVYWSPVRVKTKTQSRYVEEPIDHLTLHDLSSGTNEVSYINLNVIFHALKPAILFVFH